MVFSVQQEGMEIAVRRRLRSAPPHRRIYSVRTGVTWWFLRDLRPALGPTSGPLSTCCGTSAANCVSSENSFQDVLHSHQPFTPPAPRPRSLLCLPRHFAAAASISPSFTLIHLNCYRACKWQAKPGARQATDFVDGVPNSQR